MKSLYSFLYLLLVLATRPVMGQSHVATVTKYTGSATNTISMSFSSASTTGNLIVVHLSWDNTSRTVSSITDNKGNTYQSVNGVSTWNTTYRSELYYAFDITGGGAPITVTANLSGNSSTYFQIYMSEYSGIDITSPLDQKSANKGSTTSVSSGAKTTSMNGELIYGVSIGASGLLTKGSGFTARSTVNQNVVEDKIGTTAGTYSATFISAGGNWVAEMATFKPLVVLPVVLTGLEALVTNAGTVKIGWTTTTEASSSYFEVQRSRNGSDWTRVHALPAAGNSSIATRYTTIDSTPYSGLSYYRVLEADLDGRITYSTVVTVHIDLPSVQTVRIYPNPAVSYITVEGKGSDLQEISIVNYAGGRMNDKVRISRSEEGKATLDLSVLPKGLYLLKTKNGSTPFYKQ